MKLEQALVHLAAWAQEELGAQRRMVTLLEQQERAAEENDTPALAEVTERVSAELSKEAVRAARRSKLFDAFGRFWSVPGSVLSLTSIADRAEKTGASVSGLLRLRDDLREVAAQVNESGRRLAQLARAHREMLEDLIGMLAGPCDGTLEGGSLLTVEA